MNIAPPLELTPQIELIYPLILLLIKVWDFKNQKTSELILFPGLDFKTFSLKGCYRHGLKAKSHFTIYCPCLYYYIILVSTVIVLYYI